MLRYMQNAIFLFLYNLVCKEIVTQEAICRAGFELKPHSDEYMQQSLLHDFLTSN